MAGGGNRYSEDESYDFRWDRKFPVDASSLWPEGKLLQLQRLAFSSHLREKRHIIFLLPSKLVIAEQTDDESDHFLDAHDDGSWYRFYSGQVHNELEYDLSRIVKVQLGLSAVTMGIAIWAGKENGKSKRIFKAHDIGIPRVIKELADESVRQGIGHPSPKIIKMKEMYVYRKQLLHRIIERQFMICVPHAEIDLVGEQMPVEVFHRIVK